MLNGERRRPGERHLCLWGNGPLSAELVKLRRVRILHISDLHAPAEVHHDQREIVEAALADIEAQDRNLRVDIAVFSGDLAFDGTAEGLASGREVLLEPLAGLLPQRPVFVVPGNHDVNRGLIDQIYEAGLQTLTSRDALDAVLRDESSLAQATERLQDWEQFESEWEVGVELASVDPLAKVARFSSGNVEIGVACLNTAWRASGGDEDRGRLLVGEAQIDAALAAVDDAEVRIVVMHHPLTWLAGFDSESTRSRLESTGAFVLTGHDHTADPTTEIGIGGAAVYGRAGCMYAGHSYSNSYTLVDIDPRTRRVRVEVRRWWEARREFAQASDLPNDGVVDLAWPERSRAVAVRGASFTDVVAPLVELAEEQSVLAASHPAQESGGTVLDLLISPRFWPVPHREVVDPSLPPESRPHKVDPIEKLDSARVLIVSGGHFSGVTSSLLWILERHYRVRRTHLPVYARADARFSLGRLRDAVAAGLARAGATTAESPPVLLAVDDTAPQDSRALGRMLRFLRDNPNVTLVIGSHGEAHSSIAETLKDNGVTHERVFLGPLGRAELRELATRIVGPGSSEIVQRVLHAIHHHRLPRNPLNIAALVDVLMRETDLANVNESGLLQSYVHVLLENPTPGDPEGLAMDYRRREHLLARLATHLVRENRSRLSRVDVEQFVLDFFTEVGWTAGSAGQLIDSLIRRRVLSEDTLGVGFRYPALLSLFAGRSMLEDAEFSEFVLTDPLLHPEVIRHAAGLHRANQPLLTEIGDVAREALQYGALGVTPEQFDLMEDRHGWSQVSDLDQVRTVLRANPAPPTEEELDEIYDEVIEDAPEDTPLEIIDGDRQALASMDRVEAAVELLGGVLQNSELVPDVSLKAELLKRVILGWTLSTIVTAVKEDETGSLREIFDELLAEMDPERRQSLTEHISRLFVVLGGTFGLYASVGSGHLEGALLQVLDDDAFMEDTGNALLAVMLYVMLALPQWPSKLRALFESHGTHPMVRELTRIWALTRYRGGLEGRDAEIVEQLLADILTPVPAGQPSAAERNAQRDRVLAELRTSQTQHEFAGRLGQGGDDDEVDFELHG